MEKKSFSQLIDAPRERVWEALWNQENYPEWTAAFCEGSVAPADWKEGSKVLFVDGNGAGMAAMIEKNEPNHFMSFRHRGEVRNGVELPDSAESKACSGGLENYTLDMVNGQTALLVEVDLFPGMEDYFMNTWPRALDKVKEIAERQ